MKLIILLLITTMLQVSAASYGQRINFQQKNVTLDKVFNEIKKQTGYSVLFVTGELKGSGRIDADFKNANLEEVMKKVFNGRNLTYAIENKTIIVKEQPKTVLDKITGIFTTIDLKGKVVDGNGKPFAGATVKVKNSKIQVMTDENGRFELKGLDENAVLVVSYVGYNIKEIAIKGQSSITVVLEEKQESLDAVVISTGYSTKKVGELTGSVQTISGNDLRMGITTSDPASLLKGRATGLYISEQGAGDPTSSGGQIFVRGQSSIAGVGVDQYNEFILPTLNYGPLLVLDGVIMPNQNLKDLVTPQEIENITILKDAAATAIYGSRAAAGVLVVTTKRGTAGKARVSAEVKYGLNVPNRGTIRFLNGQELYNLQKQYYTEDYKQNGASLTQYPTVQDYLDYKLPSQADVANSFDWSKYAFINSNTKEVNVSASGGDEKTKYYVGANYYNEQSTGVNNGLVRKTFRLNLDSKLTDRLTASIGLNGISNDGKQEVYKTGTYLYSYVPWANPYNPDGSLKSSIEYKLNGATETTGNPIYDNQFNNIHLRSQLIFGSVKLNYRITDWLSLSSTNSMNLNYTKNEQYIDVRSYDGSGTSTSPQGFLGTNTNNLSSFLTSNQLSFNKKFGDHSFNALAAMEFGKTTNENMLVNVNNVRAGYPVISLGRLVGGSYDYSIYGIPSDKAGNIEGGKEESGVYSLFGELGYTFRDRYSLSASLRSDASSSFGRDNRYGTFYSGGAAWIVSQEDFMKPVKWISNLKLRVNYGTSGSQLGDNFLTNTLYDPTVIPYNGQSAAQIAVLGNPDLRWEITKTASAGLDLGLFKNRITASVDVYDRRSQDLLQKIALPSISGFPAQWKNVATVDNKGLEILINSDNIVSKNFRWNTSFNISFNKNEILKVANDSLYQGYTYYLYKGDDINALKAVKYAGVDPQTGKPLFEKLIFDSKGAVTGKEYVNTVDEVGADADPRQFQTIGSFQPKYYGGLSNTFTYKQFSLSVLITYACKYVINDSYAQQSQGTNITSYNQLAYLKNQVLWTTPGQTNATEPWFYYQANTDYYNSSKYIHSGTNASLRNVRLSYDLSASLLKRLKLANCMIYVSGDNLYTVYSKDIVSASAEGPSVGQAQDFGQSIGSALSAPRRYIFGLQVTF